MPGVGRCAPPPGLPMRLICAPSTGHAGLVGRAGGGCAGIRSPTGRSSAPRSDLPLPGVVWISALGVTVRLLKKFAAFLRNRGVSDLFSGGWR